MPKETFDFVPFRKWKKKENEKEIFVRIQKNGCLYLPQNTLNTLGVYDQPRVVKLYFDIFKRALGFRFLDRIIAGEKDASIRILNPTKTKTGSSFVVLSIKPFVNMLEEVELPTDRLYIKKYKGTYLTEEMYYVIVPKKRALKECPECGKKNCKDALHLE